MEMKDIATKTERKKEDKVASKPILDDKTDEELEPEHYAKLQSPPEDIYSEAGFRDTKSKPGKQFEGNARLYRAGCLVLAVFCMILLVAVIVLSLKQPAGSEPNTVCAERGEQTADDKLKPLLTPTCSFEQCQADFPNVQPRRLGCQQCADGWLTVGEFCFFLSTFRLSWDQSQKNCTARGGSLAIITSEEIQRFLTVKGNLNYWIGLRHSGNRWTWVDNAVLQTGYWESDMLSGDCGILHSNNPPERNWITAPCQTYSYFICQLTL